jgi:uncharacterized YigZ family protein
MDPYPIPARRARANIEVLRSRFIATAAPVFSVDEARAFIAAVRAEFADASHNVPAFLVGYGAAVTAHCSDDGEPAGTAGRPVLAVLKGADLGDVAVVVTRYFGGTKLGTGGLVRAYADAARAVLDALPRARRVATHTVGITIPYTLLERVRRLVAELGGEILDEEFTAEVTLIVRIAVADFPALGPPLQELSNGAVAPLILETNEATIMPLPPAEAPEK